MLNNIKIRWRIFIMAAVFVFTLILVAIVGASRMKILSDSVIHLINTEAIVSEYASRARANVHAMRQYEKDSFINFADKEKMKDYYKKWTDRYERAVEKLDLILEVSINDEDKNNVTAMKEKLELYKEGFNEVFQLVYNGNITSTQDANTAIGKYKNYIHDLEDFTKKFTDKYSSKVHSINTKVESLTSQVVIAMMLLIGIPTIICLILFHFIQRSISSPIKKIRNIIRNIAEGEGDLTMRVNFEAKDEIGEMAGWFNKFLKNIHDIVAQVISGAQSLSAAVEQISKGNQSLSQRTSEQASSLQEVASTIEEAATTINQSAEYSEQARELTHSGAEQSANGNKIAVETVDAINVINDSSKKISEIISVINEIAFQTNLLALNAAVEAARAGEQGRGFAVVAGEVRNLAQRSGDAAREIEGLIRDTVQKVETGTDLVRNTGEVLNDIAVTAKKAADLISEIAVASNEQKQGMEQINISVSELDKMTQDNASLVEETASASEQMTNQALDLLELVKRFKVDNSAFIENETKINSSFKNI